MNANTEQMTMKQLREHHHDGFVGGGPSSEFHKLAVDLLDSLPTGEQAGEVVVREPCKLCFGRGERTADGSNGRRVRCNDCEGTGQISRHAQPRPVGVLGEVHAERQRQDAKWGQQNHPSFTGVDLVTSNAWISKRECDRAFKNGRGSYAHILAEEVAEAFDERDDADEDKLRTELVQVAAVAVAWVECIDRRANLAAAPEVPRA